MLCDPLEGQDAVRGSFRREGTYVYLWLIHIAIGQKPTQYCEAIILQLKINLKKEIRKTTSNFRVKLKCIHLVYKVFHDFACYPF